MEKCRLNPVALFALLENEDGRIIANAFSVNALRGAYRSLWLEYKRELRRRVEAETMLQMIESPAWEKRHSVPLEEREAYIEQLLEQWKEKCHVTQQTLLGRV